MIQSHIPVPLLRPFVREFRIIESEKEEVNRILPDTSIVMVFRFNLPTIVINGSSLSNPFAVVSGISESMRSIRYAKGVKTLVVMFTEVGAAAFFQRPLNELFATSTSLENLLWRSAVDEIENKLKETMSDVQRVKIVEQFLLVKLLKEKTDPGISLAVQKIKNSHGVINIRHLADALNTSLDPFEKKFRRITGTTPKHLAAIVRLRHCIRLYPDVSHLGDIAYELGYFDQSHFIRDFKRLTSMTPGDFFKSGRIW